MSAPTLTLIANLNSDSLQRGRLDIERLRSLRSAGVQVFFTRDLEELRGTLGELERTRPESLMPQSTLAFVGGDGSLSQGLSTLFANTAWREHGLPNLLILRAGSMNYMGVWAKVSHDPWRTLRRFVAGRRGHLQGLSTLRTHYGAPHPHHGFFWAWGVGYRLLHEYYQIRRGPAQIAGYGIVAAGVARMLWPSEASRLFRSRTLDLHVDGERQEERELYSLAVGAVARICLGMRPFASTRSEILRLQVAGHGVELKTLMRNFPGLVYHRGPRDHLRGRGLVDASADHHVECEVDEGFTIDGEVFPLPEPRRVRIEPGPVVRFWSQAGR